MRNLLFLVLAITLECCGDAAIRVGLRGAKPLLFIAGAVLVICYGMTVSLPRWNFSKTMGVYIAIFFIISQTVAAVMLKEHLRLATMIGGLLIISGGIVILLSPDF